jgi:hypothetical protein
LCLPFLDYAITVNLYPLSVKQEILRSEQSLERVRSSQSPTLLACSARNRSGIEPRRSRLHLSLVPIGDQPIEDPGEKPVDVTQHSVVSLLRGGNLFEAAGKKPTKSDECDE